MFFNILFVQKSTIKENAFQCNLIADFIQLDSFNLKNNNYLGCPELPIQIEQAKPFFKFDRNTGILFINEEAKRDWSKFKGPIYIISIIGRMNSGKSLFASLIVRSLLPSYLQEFKPNFDVRNDEKDADNEEILDTGGKTYGVNYFAIPISILKLTAKESRDNKFKKGYLPEVFVKAIEKLDSKGNIIILDSEGDNDPTRSVQDLMSSQLACKMISSHIILKIGDSIGIDNKQSYESLITNQGIIDAIRNPNDCMREEENSENPKLRKTEISSLISPYTTIIPKILPGGNDARKIINKKLFQKKNNKIKILNFNYNAWDLSKEIFIGNLSTLQDKKIRYAASLYLTPEEQDFYMNVDSRKGLPPNWKNLPGLTYSSLYFTLPKIFEDLYPIQNSKSEILEGKHIINNLESIIDVINYKLPLNNFYGKNVESIELLVCDQMKNITLSWIKNDVKKLKEKIPLDITKDSTIIKCQKEDEKTNCPIELVEEEWNNHQIKEIQSRLCFYKKVIKNTPNFDLCLKEKIYPLLSQQKQELVEKQINECRFQWEYGKWSECHGKCPQKRVRDVKCVNSNGKKRHKSCCEIQDPNPFTEKSCDIWKYQWEVSIDDHHFKKMCDSNSCGTRRRNVNCKRCDGETVSDGFCPNPKPLEEEKCNQYGEWGYKTVIGCSNCGYEEREVFCLNGCNKNAETVLFCEKTAKTTKPSQSRKCACKKSKPWWQIF